MDRLVSESLENDQGQVLHHAQHAYDYKGNRICTQIGAQKATKEYDAHNQITKITNALGHTTHTTYDYNYILHGLRVLRSITTDPLGYQTIHVFDTAKRLIEIERKNPFGERIAYQKKAYDPCGNIIRTWDEAREGQHIKKVIETQYIYTPDYQIDTLIEAVGTPEQKITRTIYNACGQKCTAIKPDGTHIQYEYDAIGRLQKLATNNLTQIYTYNRNDQVISVTEPQGLTTREYDIDGNLIQETLANGLRLRNTYDQLARCTRIELPDETVVEYIYGPVTLEQICRSGPKEYSYQEKEHTVLGQIAQIAIPNQTISYEYDALGNCLQVDAQDFAQRVPENGHDAAGNLLEYEINGESSNFTYDQYYQLQSENGHTYRNDSLCNRLVKDEAEYIHNSLHQIVAIGDQTLTYDFNGNLILRMQNGEMTAYKYDALDRLIEINKNGESTTYSYDAFHRRLSKTKDGQEQLFLYQGQDEVGIWQNNKCQELRILTNDKRHIIAAIEIQDQLYFPVFDIAGNVALLFDEAGRSIESYRYTAFGQTDSKTYIGNFWQYAGKRLDPESGLIAFGVRYYDPELGRWLTPDPAGSIDGPNLYAYVHNNPLIHVDEFGFATDLFAPVRAIGGRCYDAVSYPIYGITKCYDAVFAPPQPTIIHVEFEEKLAAYYASKNQVIERTQTYDLNQMGLMNPATNQVFNLKESRNVGIGYICGMGNTFRDFCKTMAYLGNLSQYNIKGTHCPTYGLIIDLATSFNALFKYHAYEGVRELHKTWYEFFKNAAPDAIFLQTAHSRGAIYARNALMDFDPELAKRISVIAISPGGYIDRSLCYNVKHLESPYDGVPLIDFIGRIRCKDTIEKLNPHKNACGGDHTILSETYQEPIHREIEKHTRRHERYDNIK